MSYPETSRLNRVASALALSLIFTLAGCGGGGSGDGGGGVATQGVNGGAIKGPLVNATGSAYAFDASRPGFKSVAPVDTGTTNASAVLTGLDLPLPLDPPYILEFTSPAGTIDLTTGAFPVVSTLRTVVTQQMLDSGEPIYATTLSTMAVDIAVANADSNVPPFNGDNDGNTTRAEFLAALTVASDMVASTVGFGMDSSVDIFDTPPLVDSTTDTTAEQDAVAAYRSANEALTALAYQVDQQSADPATTPGTVLADLAADLADGGGINGSTGLALDANTLQVLQQEPAGLPIPTTDPAMPVGQTIADVQAILVTEGTTTAPGVPVTELDTGGSITTVLVPIQINPDIDNDGVLNINDAFPTDPTADTDTDGDGAPDVAYTDATRTVIDAARSDADDDNDGWLDSEDDFPTDATRFLNPALDRDTDTVLNATDNCPLTANTDQADLNTNGLGDVCDDDADGDGVPDGTDNCPLNANPSQTDTGGSPAGDACDPDIDGDGTPNATDAFPLDATEQIDTDNDGIGDVADADDDNDGVADGADTGVSPLDGTTPCSLLRDCDGDGFLDGVDADPTNPAVTVNFAPVALDGAVAIDEDVMTTVVILGTGGLVTDSNAGDTLTITAVGTPTEGGTAVAMGNGIDYTPLLNFSGIESFTYTVSDGTTTSTATVTVTVSSLNDAPIFTSTEITAANEDSLYTYTATVDDVDVGDALTLSAPVLPAWLTFTPGTGVLTGTPLNGDVGVHNVTLRVSDGTTTVNQVFTITVANTNDAPLFTSTKVTAATEDTDYTYTATANDVDVGDVLTLSAPVLPAWLNFDPITGVLSGTPVNANVGVHNVTLQVTDGIASDEQVFTITVANVNDAPQFTSTEVTAVNEDAAYTYTATASDVDAGDVLTLSAPVLPAWLNFDPVTGVLSGTPVNANVGVHNVTLQVSDGTTTVNQVFTITVANTNDAPVLTNDAATVGVLTLAQIDVLANDIDPDVGDPLTITAVTQGASGTVAIINAGTAVTYADTSNTAGTDSFTYTVTDNGGVMRTATVNITVTVDVPPAITSTAVTAVNEDAAYSYSVAASDADGDTATLTAPVLPTWLTFTPAAPGAATSATLTGTPTNAEVGDHSVTLRVTANGVSVDQDFTITVANINDAPTYTSTPVLAATDGVQYNYTATVQDIDPGPDTLTLSAPTLPAWLTFDPNTGVLTGTPATVDVGNHPVVIRVNDGSGDVDQSFTIVVSDIGTSIAATELLGTTNGGIAGLESFVDDIGITQFDYWTDTYDSAAAVINSTDFSYNYSTQVFDTLPNVSDELVLNGGTWKATASVRVDTADTGDGSMDVSVLDGAGTALFGLNASARFTDITGDMIATHLDAFWQSVMIDANAVFSSGAKLITQYKFAALTDAYLIDVDTDCESDDPTKFATLLNNCSAVDSTIDPSGFATTLDQTIAATAWVDPDDGTTPPDAVSLAFNASNNTDLMVRLVTGGVANFYVVDFSVAAGASTVPAPIAGTWVRDTTVQGVDMIRFDVPASILPQFPDDLADGARFLLAVESSFVRPGTVSLIGDAFLETATPLINGNALSDVLGNFNSPSPPDISSLVGSWVRTTTSVNGDTPVIHFFANGFYESSGTCDADFTTGMEYGTFGWNNATGGFAASASVSTQGSCTLDVSGATLSVAGDVMTLTVPGIGPITFNRLVGASNNPMVGSWLNGNIQDAGEAHAILTVLDGSSLLVSQNCTTDTTAGFEFGSYVWDQGVSNALSGNLSIDTNATCGLGGSGTPGAFGGITAVVSSDTLTLTISGADTVFTRISPRAPLTCAYQSGFEENADGGLGAPIVPNSFADYETVVVDCGTAMPITKADIAGNTFTDGTETSVFDNTAAAATAGDPGSGTFSDGIDPPITFQWYIEAATCSGCTHSYLVVYTDSTIDSDLPPGFQVRETQAVYDITGTNYSLVYYSEQSNYSVDNMVRGTGSDGEIWNGVSVGP